ncbi:hypothetical protein ABT010_39010 [Streptomyces sp. NPDC002668]|uniref:hypothetical protein n=1 Tax=Streptomyces sp. NPDC002668 TaxID=3154422 RepID=UPI0033176C51
MRPRLVFVHGIGGPRQPDRELKEWLDSLALGMTDAGHSHAARELIAGHLCEPVFAYYGDLFQPPQTQGGGTGQLPEGDAAEIMAALLVEWVDSLAAGHEQADVPPSPPDSDWEAQRRILQHAQAEASAAQQTQGSLSVVRRALNVATTLLALKPWGGTAQWITPKLMVRDLAQVSRYLARAERDDSGTTLDQRIRQRVTATLGDGGPAVVVAHSLGTIVALEVLHELPAAQVPLFITLGSPLAMRTVVWPRIEPRPPRTPEGLARWLNFWDRDDIIAVRPLLERDIGANTAAVLPKSSRVDSDGVWVHSASKYLAQAKVAGRVAECFVEAADRGPG